MTGAVTGTAADRWAVTLHDLAVGTSRPLTTHGDRLRHGSFDSTGRWIVTGDADGVVRVGPVTGATPHLLLGHRTGVGGVAISPDGRWVASSEAGEPTVRLWPMPEGRPLHTLPFGELMARLRAMTNMRVVRAEEPASAYQLDCGPFPGWAALAERTAP
jgi:WD40 repeat protein